MSAVNQDVLRAIEIERLRRIRKSRHAHNIGR